MLRVAYTCHDRLPSTATSTQQIVWTLVEVARLGASVTLLVPEVATGPRAADLAAAYGVPASLVPETFAVTAAGPGPAASSLAKGWFDWRVARRVSPMNVDLAWTRDAVAAVSLTRAGVPTVFETYRADLAARARFGPWRQAVFGRPALRGLIVHSRFAARAFLNAGVSESRCLVAYNGFAPSIMTPVLTREEARSRIGIPGGAPLVVYAGHIGAAKGTDRLVDLAVRVPEVRFLLVGAEHAPGDAARLEARARAEGVANIMTRPVVPVGDVAPYLYAADCLVIPPTDAPLRRFGRTVLPMKVFTYLAAGRAILAPTLPDVEEVLTDGDTARLVPPEDIAAAAAALRALLADEVARERLAARARQAADACTWQARAAAIVPFLERVAG